MAVNFGPFKIMVVDLNFEQFKNTFMESNFGPSKITVVGLDFKSSKIKIVGHKGKLLFSHSRKLKVWTLTLNHQGAG